jgi:hypothetical protein
MKFKSVLFVAVIGAALASITVPAQAQGSAGTFTLPVEAQWGAAVLPAGTYTVSTDIPVDSSVIRVTGDGTSAIILAPPSKPRDFSSRGIIGLREINGKYVVAKFTAGPVGREFSFATPKAKSREHQNTATIAVPVANNN